MRTNQIKRAYAGVGSFEKVLGGKFTKKGSEKILYNVTSKEKAQQFKLGEVFVAQKAKFLEDEIHLNDTDAYSWWINLSYLTRFSRFLSYG